MRCDRRFFEDRCATVAHVHTVHAVGTGTRRRQSAVHKRQFAAVHGDQSPAVKDFAVGGSGDLAVACDRQITSGGYSEQLRCIGFHLFARQVEGDLLGYRDVLIGDVIQQGDGVTIHSRRKRIRQCRIVALTDLRHRCNDGECARLNCYRIIQVFTQSYGDFILASILTFRTAQRVVERFALHYAFHRGS